MVIGNVNKQREVIKGWLVGQFLDEPFKDDNVEIYCKKFLKGDNSDKLHRHPVGKEYLIIISGKIKMRVDDEVFEMSEGDYIAINGGQKDKMEEVIEDTVMVGVRCPSVPNNKVFLE